MPRKKALLVASAFGGLKGSQYDVDKMARILGDLGFTICLCCGADATRDGILMAWQKLIDAVRPEDSVVVYYSGHGGTVESPRPQDSPHITYSHEMMGPWRYQFLVPVDFAPRPSGEFRGILDVELSYLLRDLTEKTRNATIILDCCFAGSMARDPGLADTAVPKGVSSIPYADIVNHVSGLRDRGRSQQDGYVDENPFAVRIAAAAASETAWEYQNAQGEWCGAMTEALERVVTASKGHHITWRTLLLRVSEMVNVQFPYQHPQVEGPRNRLLFSVQEVASEALHLREEDDRVAIQAGRVSGVHEGNIYSVMPFGAEKPVAGQELARAHVTYATPFKAFVKLLPDISGTGGLPIDGALAFPQYDALYKWPVTLPSDLPWLFELVETSRFIRSAGPEDRGLILAEFRKESDRLALYSNRGHIIAASSADTSPDERSRLIRRAEQLSRGQHLLSLTNETDDEILTHAVQVTFGVVDASWNRGRTLRQDGADGLLEGDSVYIELVNRGTETVYVWVFDINAGGKINRVSRSNSTGIEMPRGRHEILGSCNDGLRLKGLPVSWPRDLPKTTPLEETLVFIFTSLPVDLNHLSDPSDCPPPERTGISHLEQLTYSIATGAMRTVTIDEGNSQIRYSVSHIPFLLRPYRGPGQS